MRLAHGADARFLLHTGDVVYQVGSSEQYPDNFIRPYREWLVGGKDWRRLRYDRLVFRVPFLPVLGNHDIRTANGDPQVAYAPFGMEGRWYTLRRGPVQFFLLDTNGNARWQHQRPWLAKALAASTAPWKVVVGHHPIHSAGLYGDDPAAIARLTPLFRRYGVQLYINGHDHNYERTRPIDGTTYLTVGNGGAHLRAVLPNRNSARALSTYGFAELSATHDRLRIEAWDSRGRRIDQADLLRPH